MDPSFGWDDGDSVDALRAWVLAFAGMTSESNCTVNINCNGNGTVNINGNGRITSNSFRSQASGSLLSWQK